MPHVTGSHTKMHHVTGSHTSMHHVTGGHTTVGYFTLQGRRQEKEIEKRAGQGISTLFSPLHDSICQLSGTEDEVQAWHLLLATSVCRKDVCPGRRAFNCRALLVPIFHLIRHWQDICRCRAETAIAVTNVDAYSLTYKNLMVLGLKLPDMCRSLRLFCALQAIKTGVSNDKIGRIVNRRQHVAKPMSDLDHSIADLCEEIRFSKETEVHMHA